MSKTHISIIGIASVLLFALAVIIVPELAVAQPGGGADAGFALGRLFAIVQMILTILSVVIFLVFIWGLIMLLGAKSDDQKAKGKTYVIWSIVVFFLFMGMAGISRLLQNTFLGGSSEPVNCAELPWGC